MEILHRCVLECHIQRFLSPFFWTNFCVVECYQVLGAWKCTFEKFDSYARAKVASISMIRRNVIAWYTYHQKREKCTLPIVPTSIQLSHTIWLIFSINSGKMGKRFVDSFPVIFYFHEFSIKSRLEKSEKSEKMLIAPPFIRFNFSINSRKKQFVNSFPIGNFLRLWVFD